MRTAILPLLLGLSLCAQDRAITVARLGWPDQPKTVWTVLGWEKGLLLCAAPRSMPELVEPSAQLLPGRKRVLTVIQPQTPKALASLLPAVQSPRWQQLRASLANHRPILAPGEQILLGQVVMGPWNHLQLMVARPSDEAVAEAPQAGLDLEGLNKNLAGKLLLVKGRMTLPEQSTTTSGAVFQVSRWAEVTP